MSHKNKLLCCGILLILTFESASMHVTSTRIKKTDGRNSSIARKKRRLTFVTTSWHQTEQQKSIENLKMISFFQAASQLMPYLSNTDFNSLMRTSKQMNAIFKVYCSWITARILESQQLDPIGYVLDTAKERDTFTLLPCGPTISLAKLVQDLHQKEHVLLRVPNYLSVIVEQFFLDSPMIEQHRKNFFLHTQIDNYWLHHKDDMRISSSTAEIFPPNTTKPFTYIHAKATTAHSLITELSRIIEKNDKQSIVINMYGFLEPIDKNLLESLAKFPIYALYFICNEFTDDTGRLGELFSLEDLILYDCNIPRKYCIESVCNLTNLKALTVHTDSIPESINKLTKLRALNVPHTPWWASKTPKTLYELTQLRLLGIPDHTHVSSDINQLHNLKTLCWTKEPADKTGHITLPGLSTLLTKSTNTARLADHIRTLILTTGNLTTAVAHLGNLKCLNLGPKDQPSTFLRRTTSLKALKMIAGHKQFAQLNIAEKSISTATLKNFLAFIDRCKRYSHLIQQLHQLCIRWRSFNTSQHEINELVQHIVQENSLLNKFFSHNASNKLSETLSPLVHIVQQSCPLEIDALALALNSFEREDYKPLSYALRSIGRQLDQLDTLFKEHQNELNINDRVLAETIFPISWAAYKPYVTEVARLIKQYTQIQRDQRKKHTDVIAQLLATDSTLPMYYHVNQATHLIQSFLNRNLYHASMIQDKDQVQQFVDCGAQANCIGNQFTGDTPLHATLRGPKSAQKLTIARVLCEHGASLFTPDSNGTLPCSLLAESNGRISFKNLQQIGGASGTIHDILACRAKISSMQKVLQDVSKCTCDTKIVDKTLQSKLKEKMPLLQLFEKKSVTLDQLQSLADPEIYQLCMSLP